MKSLLRGKILCSDEPNVDRHLKFEDFAVDYNLLEILTIISYIMIM